MIARLGAADAGAQSAEEARLRAATAQMEGVFMTELMKALRETVPEDGMLDGGQGEDIFASMMDDAVAQDAAARQERGLGAALYRQLRTLLGAQTEQP